MEKKKKKLIVEEYKRFEDIFYDFAEVSKIVEAGVITNEERADGTFKGKSKTREVNA